MAHFKIKDLTFSFPGSSRNALEQINLTVEQGEYILLCGKSGSGKTTLLRHLKPVLTPHGSRSGEILFGSQPLSQLSALEQASRIGYVMQDPDDQTVTDQVWHELAFGLESLGCDPNTIRLRVAEMASYFGIGDWFHQDTASLSGGQKQLLNLASVMMMQPDVLILDEPTSQLDPISAADFLNTVRRINLELGTTVILTEHRLEEVYPTADRVVVMEDGQILCSDTPRQTAAFLYNQNSPLFSALPTPVRVFYETNGQGNCPLTVREGRRYLENSNLTDTQLPQQPVPSGKPALIVKDVWFRYEKDTKDVLRGLNLEVPEGSLFAIVGGNGAGKSTALKTLCGICKPYRGKIKLLGKPLKEYRQGQLFRGGLSLLPQDPKSLFTAATVRQELEEMSSDLQRQKEVIQVCQLAPLLEQHPHDLSGGEQQRLALAKVLLTDPKLLLLDEPTKGLDSFFKQKLAALLKKLTARGISVVMVSHDVEFCAEYADLVGMFFDGQVLTVDTPRHFFGSSRFYTTAASRMSRQVLENAVTAADVVACCREGIK